MIEKGTPLGFRMRLMIGVLVVVMLRSSLCTILSFMGRAIRT